MLRYLRFENVHTDIFTPRTYQVELLDKAIKRNTIVCLGSGTGKTFISVLLIRELAQQLRKPLNEGGKRTIYMVQNVDSVEYRAEALLLHTDLKVASYKDAEHTETPWDKERWWQELEENQVLVMSPSMFEAALSHGCIPLSVVNTLVFDSCHSVTEHGHPYANIMRYYFKFFGRWQETPLERPPRILGLTASVLNNQCKTPAELQQKLTVLQDSLNSTAETASDVMLAATFGTKPKELILHCSEYRDETGLVAQFESILGNCLFFLENCSYGKTKKAEEESHGDTSDGEECFDDATPADCGTDDVRTGSEQSPGATCDRPPKQCCEEADPKTREGDIGCDGVDESCERGSKEARKQTPPKSESKEQTQSKDGGGACRLEDEAEALRVPRIALMECYNMLHLLGPWCAGRVAETLGKQVEKLLEMERDEWAKRFLHLAYTQLNLISHMMTQVFDYDVISLEDFLLYVSPKVKQLLEILHEYKPSDNFVILETEDNSDVDDASLLSDDDMDDVSSDDGMESRKGEQGNVHYVAVKKLQDGPDKESKEESLCGLVFVERRHTAFTLNKLLEEMCNWDPDIFFVKSHHFTGQGYGRGSKQKETEMTAHKKQEEVLRKFRHRDYNLLVSTGVLEEGVDIPRCNLVVRFDLPQHYRSYVQSKGRARAANSKFYMLVDGGETEKFKEDLDTFKGFEKLMCHALQELDEERDEELPSDVDALLPAYTSKSEEGAPRVTLSSAIALVNRYCAKLPSDAFTHLVPDCTVHEIQRDGGLKYKCTLQLPINSPVKRPIEGFEMDSKRLAKMAVALKTCEVLHKEGEIDEQFLPIGKEMIRYEDEDNEWEETEGQARPGTTKRKQYYLKKIASALLGQPQPDKACYLYVFNMKLTCPITEEQNTRGRKIYAPEDSPRGFGFISEGRIPLVPLFPVFTRSGEVTVSIDLAVDGAVYSPEEMKRFEFFHKFVFSRVLRLDKDPMMYRPSEAPYSCLVVPIQIGKESKDVKIDWDFIEKIENCPMKISGRKYVFQKRDPKEAFVYREEDFADAVVMPSYRNIDQPQYFYVAETRSDINPRSPFPSPELFDTFQHYYNVKYGLEVTNLEQPLLDVDHTSARLNLLTPRYMNQKGVALPTSSAETRRQKRENLQQKQILVPELCDVHPFPASLWRKAVCIPAMLYRLNYLLIADEIRILISTHAQIGVPNLPYDHRFPQLEFSFPQKAASELSSDVSPVDSSDEAKAELEAEGEPTGERRQPNAKQRGCFHREDASGGIKLSDESGPRAAQQPCPKLTDCDTSNTGDTNQSKPNSKAVLSAPRPAHSSHTTPVIPSAQAEQSSSNVTTPSLSHAQHTASHIVAQGSNASTDSSDVIGRDEAGAVLTPQNLAQSDTLPATEMHLSDPQGDCLQRRHPDDTSMNPDSAASHNNQEERETRGSNGLMSFDDDEIDLENFIGPSPCLILQTLTMSNANDFFNLERLETIGDSFLKFAITVYLYCTYPGIHEGKLSYLRSKQVSNYNLYRLGKKTGFPECMVASKFEPSENWLPPGFVVKQAGAFRGLEVFVTSNADLNTKKTSECYYIDNPGKVSQVRGQLKKWEDMTFADVDEEVPVVCSASSRTVTDMTKDEITALEQEETSHIQNLTLHEITNENEADHSDSGEQGDRQRESKPVNYDVTNNYEKILETPTNPKNTHLNGVVKMANDASLAACDNSADKTTQPEATQKAPNEATHCIATQEQHSEQEKFQQELDQWCDEEIQEKMPDHKTLIPYNLQTQHSLPDKSIADCVEALIGCYLVTCGQRAALQFMTWLGLKVQPEFLNQIPEIDKKKSPFCGFQRPPSPLLTHVPCAHDKLAFFLDGYEAFEGHIEYTFTDKSYLLQAFTHASYHYNNITDCYQRLEFLGDAILDYVITRHLFEDSKKHSPGILTDLRSALVNNNIFAALAVKWDFHKYFKAVSPHLFNVINKFVQWQKRRGDVISLDEEFGDCEETKDEGEDIEIPKALGDIFESVAGAVYLDSGMSLDVVWRVYYRMMRPYIDAFTEKIPKSPVRELLEMEPETAKFERPERTMDGKIRVTVTVVGKGSFRGIGRNYRIAKSAAAKRALKHIKLYQQEVDKEISRQMLLASTLQSQFL